MTNETVTVKCSDQELLTEALSHTDAQILHADQNGLTVAKLSAEEVGRVAFDEGLIVFEPGTNRGTLEDTFFELTEGAVEFVGTTDDLHTSVNGDGPIGPSAILLNGHVDNHLSQYFLGHLCQADV